MVLRADILHGDDIEVCILDDEEGRGYGTLCNVADTVLLSLRFPQKPKDNLRERLLKSVFMRYGGEL